MNYNNNSRPSKIPKYSGFCGKCKRFIYRLDISTTKLCRKCCVSKPWLGKHHSSATKRKISGSRRGKLTGSSNHAWKGGITKIAGYKAHNQKRRELAKRLSGRSHTFQQWLTLKNWGGGVCFSCMRREPEIKLTRDHIVPISRGGTDDIANIQPLCLRCNVTKHTKVADYRPWPFTSEMFQDL